MALGLRKLVAETLLAQSGRSSRRFLEMAREWWLEVGTDPLATFGGTWDTQERAYAGDREPETCTRVSMHGAQAPAARWYLEWLDEHLQVRRLVADGLTRAAAIRHVYGDRERVIRALLYGGRGSGKSYMASEIAGVHALAVPGARVVVLCPMISHTVEIRDVLLKEVLATEWRTFTESDNTIELANGSRVELLTAKGKRDCKVGSADLVVVNEAQEIPQQLVDDLLRLDTGGMQVLTCNPPRSSRGAWLVDWHEEMLRGARPDSVQFFLDPRRNPHIPADTFTQAERLLGAVRYRREYLGDMAAPLTDVVFAGYTDAVNKLEFVPRSWRDVTAQVAELYYETPGADWLIGLDFDKRAGCTWSAGRFYLRDAGDELDDAVLVLEHAQAQIMGEQRVPHALTEFERVSGYRTFYQGRCVLIADASGDWQNEERDVEQPPQWRYLEDDGWQVISPDAHLKGNPRVWERLAVCDVLLRRIPGKGGREPLVYVLPGARVVRDSLRFYPVKRNGEPDRRSVHAHPADTWTYMAWRRWGGDVELRGIIAAEAARVGPRFLPRPERNL